MAAAAATLAAVAILATGIGEARARTSRGGSE